MTNQQNEGGEEKIEFMWTYCYRRYKNQRKTDLYLCNACHRMLDPGDKWS
jgi:hypothetical protein